VIPPNSDITVLVHRPLATGGAFIGAVEQAWNRKIVNAAFGGFYSFNFHLRGEKAVAEWLDDGIGRHIEVYDPALQMIWEGFANKANANIGTLTISRGPILNMGNKVKTMFSTIDWDLGEPAYGMRDFTDWAEDTESQAKYGIIERVISTAGATEDRAEQIRDLSLQEIKDPITDEDENLELSSIPSVTVECLGYIHWMENYTIDISTTGEQYASAKLETVLGQEPNGIFSTDYRFITENQTPVGAYDRSFRTALSIAKGITALGDDSQNRWLLKCKAGRVFEFGAIPTTIKYQRSIWEDNQNVQLFAGGNVKPWDVQAGNWVFYKDLLIGQTELTTDYRRDIRYSFIEEATYREPWSVALRGSRASRLTQLIHQFGIGGYQP
jgi:hypothetical protein